MNAIRAIVRSGHLEFLDSLDFPEGTSVMIVPVDEEQRFWTAVADQSAASVWDNTEDDVYGQLLDE